MEYSNDLGIDPSKLTEKELFNEVTELTDYMLGDECASELIIRNLELGTKACLKVLNYPKNHMFYGDKYYQSSKFTTLYLYNIDAAIKYAKIHYKNVENYVLIDIISLFTNNKGDKYKEIRELLKNYIKEKGRDYFKQVEDSLDIINAFLASF